MAALLIGRGACAAPAPAALLPLSDSVAARGDGRVMRLKGGSVWSESPAVSSNGCCSWRLCCRLLLWLVSNKGSPTASPEFCA